MSSSECSEGSDYSECSESTLHLTLANPGEGLHWEISTRNNAQLHVEAKFGQHLQTKTDTSFHFLFKCSFMLDMESLLFSVVFMHYTTFG